MAGGLRKGTEKYQHGGIRGGAGQRETDVGIHLITTSISSEHRVWEVPALVARKLRSTLTGWREIK